MIIKHKNRLATFGTVHGHKYSSDTFDFLLYISYKTAFFQKNILKLSLGRFL